MRKLLAFPNPVNEYAARATAGLVVFLAIASVIVDRWWLYLVLAGGFALRVAGGPRYSPFGRISVHLIIPMLGKTRMVPGPPKRFAQAIGLSLSSAALVCSLAGASTSARVLAGLIVAAALLESVGGLCLGCVIFGSLQRHGVIPESVCEACNNIWARS